MLKKTLLLLIVLLTIIAVGVILSYTLWKGVPLFDKPAALWALPAAVVLGLIMGAARGMLKKKSEIKGEVVVRHGIGSFVSHWGTALGIFILMASGIILGFLFIPPFAKTPPAVIAPLDMHFIGLVVTLFAGCFFAADYAATRNVGKLIPNVRDVTGGFIGKYFLRRKWTAEGKYLSSQKAAFMGYATLGAVMLITGAIKVAAHVWPITADVWAWSTLFHDIFTILIILMTLIHMGLVVALREWPAFFSWFTGTMPASFVEHEHPVWYEELKTGKTRGYKLFGGDEK